MKNSLILATIVIAILTTYGNAATLQNTQKQSFLHTYADIALANYTDTLNDAKNMATSLRNFTNNPSKKLLEKAKNAWLQARESFDQTDIFRLSNGPIDAESGWVADTYEAPEGRLNSWPLDENMIDYTTDANGKKTSGNIIDTTSLFTPQGNNVKTIDISNITPQTIAALNQNGGDANVATGYHAIEFLLWGQDQDYSNFMEDTITSGALIAGMRPLSDYTTDKNANRRKAYVNSAASLIVSDLQKMVRAWQTNDNSNYRAALLGYHSDTSKNIDSQTAKKQIFSGMGMFLKSELANERIAVAVLTPSEEEEQSCFSDNTHRDIVNNYQGFKNVLFGTYHGKNYGFSAISLLSDDSKIMHLLTTANNRTNQIDAIAKTSRHFDYQIRPNDPQSSEIIKLKNNLRKLGDMVVDVARANGVNLGN